jgi:hypothetical protein
LFNTTVINIAQAIANGLHSDNGYDSILQIDYIAYLSTLKVLKCPQPEDPNETISWHFERVVFDKILFQMTLAQGRIELCTEETLGCFFDIIDTDNDGLISFADM